MNITETIKKIFGNDLSVEVKKISLSFIERIFPEYKDYVVIYKTSKKYINDKESSHYDLEVTGNPLQYSFNDECINTTLITEKYWYQDEEKYVPFRRIEASELLNLCHLNLRTDVVVPIFVLCDGKDCSRTAMLGTIIKKNKFITIEVKNNDMIKLDTIENCYLKIFSNHLEMSYSKANDVSVSTLSTYNIFGLKREMRELSEIEKLYFEGSITLNTMVDNMIFNPPIRSSKNNLILEIITGRKDSALTNLWNQLLLLNQYLMVLDTFKKIDTTSYNNQNLLEYPNNFVNPCGKDQDKIMDDVNFLLTNDYSYRKSNNNKIEETYIEKDENNIQLKQCIEDTLFRPNLDFTDYMWELLMRFSTYTQMTNCMHKIFKEILIGEYQPQLNITSSTKLSKILSELSHQRTVKHLLEGCLPLENLIDIGFEKVSKDYKYILMKAGIIKFDSIFKKFEKKSEKFDSNFFRKKLINMIQVHICLEFMLLLQKHISYQTDVLQSSLEYVLKEMTTTEFSTNVLKDLCIDKVYALTIPAENILINEFDKGIPATWKINLVSESGLSETKTIIYFSDNPIFPPNLYSTDQIYKVNKAYHMVTTVISSNEIPDI